MLERHVLGFSTSITVFEELQNFNFKTENLNVIILANYVIGEKILNVLNTDRHIFGQKIVLILTS